MRVAPLTALVIAVSSLLVPLLIAEPVAVVREGRPVVSAVYLHAEDDAEDQPLRQSVRDFVGVVREMTGAEVPVVAVSAAGEVPAGPAVVVGRLAAELGAEPSETSLWQDQMRTVVADDRVLVAGESNLAASHAVMDLLHEKGVRFLLPETLPGDPGRIVPESAELVYEARDHERHPLVRSRRLWGHNLGLKEPGQKGVNSRWIRRNAGLSPVFVSEVHAWGKLIPKDQQRPELYAIKRYEEDGEPVRGKQFCVTEPDTVRIAAQTLIDRFAADPTLISQSISPVDGGGACICPDCLALDPVDYREPSSGKPAISDRYLYFHNKLAERVAEEFPDRYLAFYVYSDYSRVPLTYDELHPMLLPTFAPIRYPRIHSMFNPISDQNIRLRNEIIHYGQTAEQIGYYGYNFNLAESIVPFSKISIWSQDLPWLVEEQDLIHVSMETHGNWNNAAPHIYLSARYPYSGEDPAAIMDDYFEKLGGAASEPLRAYWEAVDDAFVNADVHSGSVYGIELILTPQVIKQLQGHLDEAMQLAETDRERQVVELFQSGLTQGRLLVKTINHLNAVEFEQAEATRDRLRELGEEMESVGVLSKYPMRYRRAFIDHAVDAGAAIGESGGQIVKVLPRTWQVRMDHYGVGMEEEWYDPARSDAKWQTVETWGAPSMYSQGFGDFKGYQWFRVKTDVPADAAERLRIWFGSNDGTTRLWVNGQPITFNYEVGRRDDVRQVESVDMTKSWRAFDAAVGEHLEPGEMNTFVVRIDHNLNDLNLGGILRPVLLYQPGEGSQGPIEDDYEKPVM